MDTKSFVEGLEEISKGFIKIMDSCEDKPLKYKEIIFKTWDFFTAGLYITILQLMNGKKKKSCFQN